MGLFDQLTTPPAPSVQVAQAVSLSSAVQSSVVRLRELTRKAKEETEAVEGKLLTHEGYFAASEAVKQAQKGRKDARSAVLSDDPDLYDQVTALKTLRADVSAERVRLSELLLEYERSTGQLAFETPDGTLLTIRKTASVQLSLF